MKALILVLFLIAGVARVSSQSTPKKEPMISLKTLLQEMTNRDALTRFPSPAFTLSQVTSWDRAELNKNDKASWFGNKDYGNYIRLETNGSRKEYVIMDAKGPGAITRWWIPSEYMLNRRIVRVYIDNNPTPVIEENYDKLINGASFVKWPFAFTSSDEKDAEFQYGLPVGFPKQMGADFYLPLPFSTACKVTLDDDPFYYAIGYRLYAAGTKAEPFSRKVFDKNEGLIKTTGQALVAENVLPALSKEKKATIEKDKSIEINLPPGEHAINAIHLKINAENNKQMNRAVVLQIFEDGIQTASSPVSEFFGGGVYARPVKNRYIEVTKDGWMISNWVMPYKKSAKIILKNFGADPVSAELKVGIENYHWTHNSMYFHASWHEEAPVNTPPFKDWNYIEITGKGKYTGDVLTVHSIPKIWWGEGDEKIYLDGESFPSQLGTGTEDYYGYAWGIANYFNSPFISMPARDARGKADWSGYNTVARMRILDDITFDKSLKVDMEAWHGEPGVTYSVTCFWYGIPLASDNIKADEKTITRKLPDFHPSVPDKTPGGKYPDPEANRLLTLHSKGNVRYAGDKLDLLEWRDKNIPKSYDADKDNVLGTAGYIIFGKQFLDQKGLHRDSVSHLPAFITAFTSRPATVKFGGAALPIPDTPLKIHVTGLLAVKSFEAKDSLVSFIIDTNAPSSFRLGIMLDNADTFDKIGKTLWVTSSRDGNSGEVSLAPSNRVPDWYFFDLTDLQPGDKITIHGWANKEDDVFSIGGLTFDLNK